VRLVVVWALVLDLTVMRAGRLNDLAVRAQLVGWQFAKQLSELKLIFAFCVYAAILLDIAGLATPAEIPCSEELHTDERGRDHEVVRVHHGLENYDLSDEDVEEKDTEHDISSVVARHRHHRQAAQRAGIVPT